MSPEYDAPTPPVPFTSEVLDRWRSLLTGARSDLAWSENHRRRDEAREAARPQIVALLDAFRDGALELIQFSQTFDSRTRGDWDLFGLKGPSGAMFVNTIAKHVGDREEATSQLRRAIQQPSSADSARALLRGFHGYLTSLVDSGIVTRRQVQPPRAAFFLSAAWHMREPDLWPIFYDSAKQELERDGLFDPDDDPVESYSRFRDAFRSLETQLGTRRWELEHLCVRLAAERTPTAAEAEPPTAPPPGSRVWLIAPGPNADRWDDFRREGIVAIGWESLGDLSSYETPEAIKEALRAERPDGTEPKSDARACWEFAHEMQPGDLIFAKKGRSLIIGHGVITSGYRHEPSRSHYQNVRTVDWRSSGMWKPRDRPLVMKTLTEIGGYPQLVADIKAAMGLDAPADPMSAPEPTASEYVISDAANELFMTAADIEALVALLQHRKNLILQGPPGVGKTYLAQRIAWLLIGARRDENICTVQFHQAYGYEDFVQGYRPLPSGGFALRDGPFLRFCDRALQDRDEPYVMIIDEINRGNLSKILGELMMLLESDKRDPSWAVSLAYSDEAAEKFYVPPNLYVIGTMNTADRSLAMVDYALRRRFAFYDLQPDFDDANFVRHLDRLGVPASLSVRIRERLKTLNQRIAEDPSLGTGFCVGHSYFCSTPLGRACDDDWYERIVNFEIAPLLREYWFDRPQTASQATEHLLGAL